MKRSLARTLLAVSVLCGEGRPRLHGAVPTPAPSTIAGPNVVILVADDFGFEDVDWRTQSLISGGTLHTPTPNLARLAKEGVRFDPFYTDHGFVVGMDQVQGIPCGSVIAGGELSDSVAEVPGAPWSPGIDRIDGCACVPIGGANSCSGLGIVSAVDGAGVLIP